MLSLVWEGIWLAVMMVHQAGKPGGLAGCVRKPCSKAFISFLNSACNVCITVRLQAGGFYAVARVGRVPTESCLYAAFRMLMAALVSRSNTTPQCAQR